MHLKHWLAASLLGLAAGSAIAQAPPGGGPPPEMREAMEKMRAARRGPGNPAVVVLGFTPADPGAYGRVIVGSGGRLDKIVESRVNKAGIGFGQAKDHAQPLTRNELLLLALMASENRAAFALMRLALWVTGNRY